METKVNNLQWKIGGEAGHGIKITGQMFSRLCVRGGLHIFDYAEYPSLIRGGHNTFHVAVREASIKSIPREVHLLVALNQETIALNSKELVPGAGLIFDPEQTGVTVDGLKEQGIQLFPVPLVSIATKAGGTQQMRNTVALGATVGILNYDFALLESVIHTAFDRKGEQIVQANIDAARAGYDYAEKIFSQDFPHILKRQEALSDMVITGNEAISMGAIKAGCGYYAAYPMTPASSILGFLAKRAEKTGMIVRHAEDEIAAINSVVGASFSGVRSMVGTSGGGYALMVEGTGLAAMVEAPIVIVNVQRPGPATGLPTWSGQGDLQFVLHAAQDDFPRIVLAPGDATECFYMTFEAFNLAEKYQTPVILLSDKFLGESHMNIPVFDEDGMTHDRGELERNPQEDDGGLFKRYRTTDSGISPRTLPGQEHGIHIANSDEHDEYGLVDETAENRNAMMEKRMRKMETAAAHMPLPQWYGPEQADVTLVCWGSTKGMVLEALPELERLGKKVNVLHFTHLHPLPKEKVIKELRKAKKTMVCEQNYTGQFAQHLQSEVGLVADERMLKYDGRPFFPSEIVEKVQSLL